MIACLKSVTKRELVVFERRWVYLFWVEKSLDGGTSLLLGISLFFQEKFWAFVLRDDGDTKFLRPFNRPLASVSPSSENSAGCTSLTWLSIQQTRTWTWTRTGRSEEAYLTDLMRWRKTCSSLFDGGESLKCPPTKQRGQATSSQMFSRKNCLPFRHARRFLRFVT